MSICYVCRSPEIDQASPPHSQLCTGCAPARDHIVSMKTGEVVCQCGWRASAGTHAERDALVHEHWQSIIREAAAA